MRAGFALDYPQGWYIQEVSQEIKEQAVVYTITLTSWEPEMAGQMGIPEGGTKVDISVIKSGAQTPAEAFAARKREIGNADPPHTILSEEAWTLSGELPALRLQVESTFGEAAELITAIHGHTLLLGGLGDFALFDEIAGTLREIEPETQAGLLPAPVIYLGAEKEGVAPGTQNLWRLEVDGTTTRQLTDESVSIAGFAVSPRDGSIVYATFGDNELYRIDADGSGRTLLFDGQDMTGQPENDSLRQIANLAWSPDGAWIAFGMDGIYVIPAAGGEPQLLVADLIVTEGSPQDARYYRPISWSPDGSRILALEGFGVEGASYAVVEVPGGEVTSLGHSLNCCEPSWNLDGTAFYFSSPVYGLIMPGLWRAEAASGEVTTLIAGFEGPGFPENSDEDMSLVQSVRQLRDGSLYAFVAFGSHEELFLNEQAELAFPRLTMARISPAGTEVEFLRSDGYVFGEALWAQDGSGAVINVLEEEDLPNAAFLWLTSDDAPAVVLAGEGFHPQWGK
jgi:hypothetical protein